MTEQEEFKAIVDAAVQNRSSDKPENAEEFQVHCDNHYNLYMYIKGEWQNMGINVTAMYGGLLL